MVNNSVVTKNFILELPIIRKKIGLIFAVLQSFVLIFPGIFNNANLESLKIKQCRSIFAQHLVSHLL